MFKYGPQVYIFILRMDDRMLIFYQQAWMTLDKTETRGGKILWSNQAQTKTTAVVKMFVWFNTT